MHVCTSNTKYMYASIPDDWPVDIFGWIEGIGKPGTNGIGISERNHVRILQILPL